MTTLSSGYEGQLSAMSDHLCELRDKLAKTEEGFENPKKGKVSLFNMNHDYYYLFIEKNEIENTDNSCFNIITIIMIINAACKMTHTIFIMHIYDIVYHCSLTLPRSRSCTAAMMSCYSYVAISLEFFISLLVAGTHYFLCFATMKFAFGQPYTLKNEYHYEINVIFCLGWV